MIDRHHSQNIKMGTLYITATHLIFIEPESNKETWVLHMHIASVEKLPLNTIGSPLLIKCKTFLSLQFVISKDSECHDVYITLLKLFRPGHISKLYCFSYKPGINDVEKSKGWNMFPLENEYLRMGVPNDKWKMCSLNICYELCSTYPSKLFVPAGATESMLIGSSKFRSKGRLPVLAYLHHNKVSLSRCSQPLAGLNARCLEDEQMLESIRRTNERFNHMYVVDTRPKINAMANRATGKGYENEAFYEHMKFKFIGIENIHVMRSSIQKLLEICEPRFFSTMGGFLNILESSGWLKHIRCILKTARFVANAIRDSISVIIHCSDGWDRTAQVCSVSALILDPFYRTIKGFQALIEKDWLAFGYKFSDRCGHMMADAKEVSPIFTQFLDCTWQIINQNKSGFEFNERFLLAIHDHVYSCQFGTFIGNCQQDRLHLKLSEQTYSVWEFLSENQNEYINPLFNLDCDQAVKVDLAPQNIKYWRGMYTRFESGVHPREPIIEYLSASRSHSHYLLNYVQNVFEKVSILKGPSAKRNYCTERLQANNELMKECFCCSFLSLGVLENVLKVSADTHSFGLNWIPLRDAFICSCSTPFDHYIKKNYCWKCGMIFCFRCIQNLTSHQCITNNCVVSLCQHCYESVSRTLFIIKSNDKLQKINYA